MAEDILETFAGGEEGGYVDDDLDLDDDVLDGDIGGDVSKDGDLRSAKKDSTLDQHDVRQDSVHAAVENKDSNPKDYKLSVASKDERDFIVARFLTPLPDLSPPCRMRALREKEESLEARKDAIKADRKQHMYYKSHLGKKRTEVRLKQGYTEIPDRDRKRWTVDVYDPQEANSADGKATQHSGLKANGVDSAGITQTSSSTSRPSFASGSNGSRVEIDSSTPQSSSGGPLSEQKSTVFDTNISDTRQYVGSFEGKSSSQYAMLVIDDRTRTAKLTPVGPYSWFSFRQKRGRRPVRAQTIEGAERALKKRADAGMGKISKYHENAGEAQAKAEFGLGSMTAVRAKRENAKIGIFRGQETKIKKGESVQGEGLDFEEEFDNDDVAQVDKEEEEDPEESRVVDGDSEANAKKFRKMIKDEDTKSASRPQTPGSDSEEDYELSQLGADQHSPAQNAGTDAPQGQSPTSSRGSHTKSPRNGGSPSRATNTAGHALPPRAPGSRTSGPQVSTSSGVVVTGASAGLRPASTRVSTPMISSPSSSSNPGTPLRQEYAHLLPPPGQLPTAKHVTDVLSAMLQTRGQPIPLKEFTRIFERDTPEQKQNLASIMKQVAQLTVQEQGSRVFYVSLRSSSSST